MGAENNLAYSQVTNSNKLQAVTDAFSAVAGLAKRSTPSCVVWVGGKAKPACRQAPAKRTVGIPNLPLKSMVLPITK